MLYFVQQFGRVWLQTRKFRPKCCTFYNNEPQYWFIPPFLLYKIQHLLYLENSPRAGGPFSSSDGAAPAAWESILKNQIYLQADFSTPQATTDDEG
ncbi:hypothetical protein [Paenibacillus ginsengihumi]|uniref:hypothetical protein n=1 Tax=Paenibacillus ginsengihumi TaxID=431596 RepID=UPI000A039275|nr:hypothetical protein [Paenibacillus ginsengihumi]